MLQKKCIRNVCLAKYNSHTQPLFKILSILNFDDKIIFLRSVFMNLYRNKQLPETFIDKFTNITCTDQLQTRHNDYNYLNIPAVVNWVWEYSETRIIIQIWHWHSVWQTCMFQLQTSLKIFPINVQLIYLFIQICISKFAFILIPKFVIYWCINLSIWSPLSFGFFELGPTLI